MRQSFKIWGNVPICHNIASALCSWFFWLQRQVQSYLPDEDQASTSATKHIINYIISYWTAEEVPDSLHCFWSFLCLLIFPENWQSGTRGRNFLLQFCYISSTELVQHRKYHDLLFFSCDANRKLWQSLSRAITSLGLQNGDILSPSFTYYLE